MRRDSKASKGGQKRANLNPVSCRFDSSVMDLLPVLASTVLASTVSLLRENAVFQSINKKLNRRTMSSPEMCWPVPMRAIGAQNLLTMPGGVSNAGYLHKKGGSQFSLMKWPLRYTIIHKGCVYYFKSSTSPAPQGAFSLNGYNRVMRAAEETTSSNVFPFKIVHFSKKHRTWFFSAASEDERRKWMRYLRREIDYYNDRKECHFSSDSDSDADSFYGTIERPMVIKHPVDNTDHDYVEEDEDDDEEDYLKPDGSCSPTSTGRLPGPPPSYPPPPVPSSNLRQDSSPLFHKREPPPIPPLHTIPTIPFPKKPPPSLPPTPVLKDLNKGPPPPLPFAPHLQKPTSPSPPLPPLNTKKTLQSKIVQMGGPGTDKKDWGPPSVVENGPAHSSHFTGASQSQNNNHQGMSSINRNKQSIQPLHVAKPTIPTLKPVVSESLTSSSNPQRSPHLKPGLLNKPALPKPSPPPFKPPVPAVKSKPPGTPIQASPDGQSFRSLGEETSTESRKKRDSSKSSKGDDSEEDYVNVQLPDSVFIDTTETSFAEKLFKDGPTPPQDGLYCIRNSGTKTSKVLVVWDSGIAKARNYRLFEEGGLIFVDSEVTFPNLSALIEHYYSHPLPHHGSLCLQKPYTGMQSS
ncbi:SH3 domain-binding protein 2 isoform X2 [Cheilinus undulatus]|uniref:SH3 domain-binding protein 2 isoform X2 n=1 Tax=Cheilinus undulatus TaxID=241271 RepID=UPI001BD6CFB6|nr:SH3 domain-binding protein 2 isoform X2 [Cheilinus undulatus]